MDFFVTVITYWVLSTVINGPVNGLQSIFHCGGPYFTVENGPGGPFTISHRPRSPPVNFKSICTHEDTFCSISKVKLIFNTFVDVHMLSITMRV